MRTIEEVDGEIAVVEGMLTRLNEERREIVNHGNLNKCDHSWNYNQENRRKWCSKCSATEVMEDPPECSHEWLTGHDITNNRRVHFCRKCGEKEYSR